MSGCCGQGPVIVSGAAATPRIDAESTLLCDVLPDGTVAGVALVEALYDASSGARVGTRTVDPVTGAAYAPQGTLGPCSPDGCNATTDSLILCDVAADGTATPFVRAITYDCEGALLATLDRTLAGTAYTVTGTVGVCPTSPDCEALTTPTATIGLCLSDGTPIAVTVVRDCTGAVTSEGWINLTTGAWSAGAVPAGTVACGSSQSVQVSGTFCDVLPDGTVAGLVLVEYSYADDGTVASVRLVDATTGTTYTPTGTVTTCPAGVAQPERDLLQLCDTAADGTVTAFVRDYARDENGAIVGHSDYALDGTPYTPAGTVDVCQPAAELCRNSQTVMVCDVPATSTTTITDASGADAGLGRFPDLPGPYTPLWTGGSLVWPANPGPAPAQIHPVATGLIAADLAGCDGASGTLNVSVRVTNNGPGRGQAWDGALQITKGTALLASQDALHDAPAGWTGTLSLSVPVTAADVAAGDLYVALILETFHLSSKGWTADQFTMSLELEGCDATTSTQFLRTLVTDCATGEIVAMTDTTMDGQPYTVTGDVAQCIPADPPTECRDCEQVILCDTVGSAVTSFLRTVCRDCTGAVIGTLDTDLDGTTAYEVAGAVGRCCDTQVVSQCTYSLPDTSAGWNFADPAFPGCWIPTALNPSYTYGDRVTSWAANYGSDTGSAAVVLFSSPDLGGAISFAAFTPALPVSVANSSPTYVGTAVINGVTVTLTATGGDGLARWSANNDGLYLNGTDSFRLDFSEPVRLAITTSAFGDPLTVHERFCGVTAATVPWQAVKLVDCNGNVSVVDPDTRLPIPTGVTLDCQPTGGSSTDGCTKQLLERCGCDDTDGDGIGDVIYTELWAIDPCGGEDPALIGTYEDGDPAKPYTPTAPVECTVEDASTDGCTKQLLERCGCSDEDGDGLGEVMFTELWAIDPCGTDAPVLLGTYADGDLTKPFTPTAPVECTVEEDTAPAPLSTGVRAATGTAPQDLAGEFAGLQNVSLTVLAGTTNVTMTDGSAVPIPAGVTMTWSVAKDEDSALAAAAFVGASAASSYLLNYTYR